MTDAHETGKMSDFMFHVGKYTHNVAITSKAVKLTWMTMSKYSSMNLFIIWLTKINVVVGRFTWHEELLSYRFIQKIICRIDLLTVSKLERMGLPKMISTIISSFPSTLLEHIAIFLMKWRGSLMSEIVRF